MNRILLFLAFTCLTTHASAQTVQTGVGRDQKSVQMVRTATAPVIDGVLDDAEWQDAALIDNLHQIIPVEYAEPSEKTEIRLLFDDNFLYVGAKMFIDPALISRNVLRRNGNITQDDYFFVSFDPFNNQRGGFFFGVNANGVRQDGLYRNISEFFGDWDSIYYVETTIVADGWIAEYAIPFKSISFDPASDTWGMNFSRKIQSRNEQMTWVSNDRRFDPSSAGKAVGFTGLEQGLGLDVIPSVSLNRARRYDPAGTENNFEPSLDVFYKVTSSLNAALTINTDFSATEVDDRQVNLTRFGLFFPEKREFFLRDSDIFEFGRISQNGQPFFSRKIGLGRTGEALDLQVGGKVSGRVGDWEIGALSIRQDESPGLAADTLSVVRLKTGVLSESTIGAIFTDGDPTSNLDNSLAGADFLYRNSRVGNGRIFEVVGWYQQTSTEGISDDDTAQGLSVYMPSTEGLSGGISARRYDQNFHPALGFVNRVGVDYYNSELNYTWRPDSDRWQTLYYSLRAERYNDVNGNLQSQSLGVTPLELTSATGDAIFLRSNFEKEVLTMPFRIYPGVVIPVGSYDFQNHGIELRSAQYRKVSGRLAFVDGSFYGGNQTRVFGNVTWVPSPRIRTNIGFNITDVTLPQGDFITRLFTAGFDYVFSNSLSLVNLVQYDNVSETAGVNLRLHWIPQEGQEFFFVINHTLEDFDRDNRFASYYTDVTAKFSYTFRY
jgi:hypothetical protein